MLVGRRDQDVGGQLTRRDELLLSAPETAAADVVLDTDGEEPLAGGVGEDGLVLPQQGQVRIGRRTGAGA